MIITVVMLIIINTTKFYNYDCLIKSQILLKSGLLACTAAAMTSPSFLCWSSSSAIVTQICWGSPWASSSSRMVAWVLRDRPAVAMAGENAAVSVNAYPVRSLAALVLWFAS